LSELAWAYRRLSESIGFLAQLEIITYDEKAMRKFEDCASRRSNWPTDLRIASVVLEYGATLVTENARDFMQVPG